jgi:hypothetical protein
MKRLFEQCVLTPDSVFAEVPAVVAPEHDDGIFGEPKFLEAA